MYPTIGSRQLDKLRTSHVEAMLKGMADAGKARSTVVRARSVLKLALDDAERLDIIVRNVARIAKIPMPPDEVKTRSLTHEEAKRLLVAAKGDRLETAWLVALSLGLRSGEVRGLKWADIDLDAPTLTVNQAVKLMPKDGPDSPEYLYLGNPKTKKSRRKLQLAPMVVTSLMSHRLRQAAERLAAGERWSDLDLVFPSKVGTILDASNYRRHFDAVAAIAGISDIHPHLLRHSFVSLLMDDGVPAIRVADSAGHTDTRMTERVYRHALEASESSHVEPMERILAVS